MNGPHTRNNDQDIPVDPNRRPVDDPNLGRKLARQQAAQGARSPQMGGNWGSSDPSEVDLGRDGHGRRIPYPTD